MPTAHYPKERIIPLPITKKTEFHGCGVQLAHYSIEIIKIT